MFIVQDQRQIYSSKLVSSITQYPFCDARWKLEYLLLHTAVRIQFLKQPVTSLKTTQNFGSFIWPSKYQWEYKTNWFQ
jgi:hypothetical protein